MNVSKEIAGKQGRKGLKVVFTSDKRKSGRGAQCTAKCIDPAPTTTPTPGTSKSKSSTYSLFKFIKPLLQPQCQQQQQQQQQQRLQQQTRCCAVNL